MWMIYGKRTTDSSKAMMFVDEKDAEAFLDKVKAGKTYYDPIFEIRKAR